MRLYSSQVLGLRENLEELVIGEKVETREGHPLCLQVLAKSLLHLVQQLVALSKVLKEAIVSTERNDLRHENKRALILS